MLCMTVLRTVFFRDTESLALLLPLRPSPCPRGGSSANFYLKKKKIPAKIRSRRRRPWVMNDFLCPTMPCSAVYQDNRVKNPKSSFGIPALVARPVSKAEIARNPTLKTGSCLDALKKEWKRLRDRKVWDESTVINWSLIASKARKHGDEIHLGKVFGIMVEKNHELSVDDPNRKFKYRVVFQGNNVCDQDYAAAVFQDLGSSPASMEASKNIDCYGCFLGHRTGGC